MLALSNPCSHSNLLSSTLVTTALSSAVVICVIFRQGTKAITLFICFFLALVKFLQREHGLRGSEAPLEEVLRITLKIQHPFRYKGFLFVGCLVCLKSPWFRALCDTFQFSNDISAVNARQATNVCGTRMFYGTKTIWFYQ